MCWNPPIAKRSRKKFVLNCPIKKGLFQFTWEVWVRLTVGNKSHPQCEWSTQVWVMMMISVSRYTMRWRCPSWAHVRRCLHSKAAQPREPSSCLKGRFVLFPHLFGFKIPVFSTSKQMETETCYKLHREKSTHFSYEKQKWSPQTPIIDVKLLFDLINLRTRRIRKWFR